VDKEKNLRFLLKLCRYYEKPVAVSKKNYISDTVVMVCTIKAQIQP